MIDNVFYDFDKATLREESTVALDKLVQTLNDNPNITIELSAHTDYRGSDTYNKRLSQKRAESVVDYLIAHGIAADRLTPMGYGEERPKKVKKKLTEKLPWLKEGDELTEKYITRTAGGVQSAEPPDGVSCSSYHLRDVRRKRQSQTTAKDE